MGKPSEKSQIMFYVKHRPSRYSSEEITHQEGKFKENLVTPATNAQNCKYMPMLTVFWFSIGSQQLLQAII